VVVRETWDAAYLGDARAGFAHTTTRLIERGGHKAYQTTTELELTVRRFQDTVRMRSEQGTEETLDGRVIAVSMKQTLGKEQQLVVRGTVDGDVLEVVSTSGGQQVDQRVPWDNAVIGQYAQERLFQSRKVKPGDRFSYLSYEPTIARVLRNDVVVRGYEDLPGALNKKHHALRVEVTPDKIGDFQLPTQTVWLDQELLPLHSEVDMPGLGKLILRRTDQRAARALTDVPRLDVGYSQLIKIATPIPNPHQTHRAIYRITVQGDGRPETTFAQDGRQQVKNVRGNSFELHIRAAGEPKPGTDQGQPGKEYLETCYFVNCADREVRRHAADAVGDEPDAWEKARRIERWVHTHMQNKNFTEAFATADHVARTLEGDCTEHSMLAAAMCRAVGVPSKVSVGLLYVDMPERGPVMAFHMWTEVWVHGQWVPIDATLGLGYVGATHLKIADSSWHNIQSLTPLLPALRVLGKVSIDVLEVAGPS
jgi:hypothetical protein